MRLPFGLRWWELLPEVLLGLGLGLFAVTEPSASASAFGSTRALVLMAVVAGVWLALRIVLVRHTRWPALRLVVFAVGALAILKVVVLPAYQDKTVIETLPVATVATVAGTHDSTTTTSTQPEPAPAPAPAAPEPAPVVEEPVPVALRSGAISGIDHRASGTATIYRQPDGSFTVGLEGIDIQPGPDYDVLVVPGAGREDKQDETRLGDLKGNKGTQYYAVPAGVSLGDGDWTVLVWCETFDVPVAAATPV